jgi:hypothetical protein
LEIEETAWKLLDANLKRRSERRGKKVAEMLAKENTLARAGKGPLTAL